MTEKKTLREFVREHGGPTKAAALLGGHPSTISRILSGKSYKDGATGMVRTTLESFGIGQGW